MKRTYLALILVFLAGIGAYALLKNQSHPIFSLALCDGDRIARINGAYESNEDNLNGSFILRLYGQTLTETYTLASFFTINDGVMEEVAFELPSEVCERTIRVDYSFELDRTTTTTSEIDFELFSQNVAFEVTSGNIEASRNSEN